MNASCEHGPGREGQVSYRAAYAGSTVCLKCSRADTAHILNHVSASAPILTRCYPCPESETMPQYGNAVAHLFLQMALPPEDCRVRGGPRSRAQQPRLRGTQQLLKVLGWEDNG